MLTMAMQRAGRVIEPVGEYVYPANTTYIDLGIKVKEMEGEGNGIFVSEDYYLLNIWALGVHYWLEIVFVISTIVFMWQVVKLWRFREGMADVKVGEAFCAKCGYGLTGLGEGVDVCPECGCAGVGEGGKRRQVQRKWVMGGRKFGKIVAVMSLVGMLIMGVFWYGGFDANRGGRQWRWLDGVAEKMGGHGHLAGSKSNVRYSIRDIGAKQWVTWRSGWLYGVVGRYGDGLFKGVRLHVEPEGVMGALMLVDGEVVRKPMVYEGDEGERYEVQDYLSGPYVPRPEMFSLCGMQWYYVHGWHDEPGVFWMDKEEGLMKLFEVEGLRDVKDELDDLDRMRVELREMRDEEMGGMSGASGRRDMAELEMGEWNWFEVGEGVYLLHCYGRKVDVDWYIEQAYRKQTFIGIDVNRKKMMCLMVKTGLDEFEAEVKQEDRWARTKGILMKVLSKGDDGEGSRLLAVIGEKWQGEKKLKGGADKGAKFQYLSESNFSYEEKLYLVDERLEVDEKGKVYRLMDGAHEKELVGVLEVGAEEIDEMKLDESGKLWVESKSGDEQIVVRVYDVSEILEENEKK
ncbi:hypothetical protein JD969_12515 [Planctomycetota bacterium]|nr:hypothetical protein JD969_12515 [Planctomycetota bacterium]